MIKCNQPKQAISLNSTMEKHLFSCSQQKLVPIQEKLTAAGYI